MGVPALFRWLSAKYPKIVEKVIEAPSIDEEGNEVLINLKDANPNGTEFDNLYLDMNGIIHPCCHPMDKVHFLFLFPFHSNALNYFFFFVSACSNY